MLVGHRLLISRSVYVDLFASYLKNLQNECYNHRRNKGMGRAIAEQFAGAGYSIVACARSEKGLLEMKNNFSSRFIPASVTVKVVDIG